MIAWSRSKRFELRGRLCRVAGANAGGGDVSIVRRAFNAQKAGHAGTLDPLATGVLPIALGEATKTVPYVMDGAKIYRFTVAWGEERSTDDLEGPVTNTSELRPEQPVRREPGGAPPRPRCRGSSG